jgi:hypothetical protein
MEPLFSEWLTLVAGFTHPLPRGAAVSRVSSRNCRWPRSPVCSCPAVISTTTAACTVSSRGSRSRRTRSAQCSRLSDGRTRGHPAEHNAERTSEPALHLARPAIFDLSSCVAPAAGRVSHGGLDRFLHAFEGRAARRRVVKSRDFHSECNSQRDVGEQ